MQPVPQLKNREHAEEKAAFLHGKQGKHLGLSENVGYIPNEIAIFHRDNDQQNHWVQWGTQHFQTHPRVR